MKVIEISRIAKRATPGQLFAEWGDLPARKVWDKGIETIHGEGSFGLGMTGEIKVKGQPARKFEIVEFKENEIYTDRFFLPLGSTMDWRHTLRKVPEGVEVKWLVEVHGPTALLLLPIMKNILSGELPETIERFIAVTERKLSS
jgi:hypothetical protein